jgi:hypothetical protein
VCHARFSPRFRETGDAPPVRPSVFRRERVDSGFRDDFSAALETRESKLWRGFQPFRTRRFRGVA